MSRCGDIQGTSELSWVLSHPSPPVTSKGVEMSQRQDRVIPTCWMSNSWVRCRRPVYPSICLGQPGYDDIHHKGELVRPAHWLSASGGRRYLRRREIPRLCVRVKNISVRCANGSPFAPTFFGRSAGLTGSCIQLYPVYKYNVFHKCGIPPGPKCWNTSTPWA